MCQDGCLSAEIQALLYLDFPGRELFVSDTVNNSRNQGTVPSKGLLILL